jgi:molecular chaperone HtpG
MTDPVDEFWMPSVGSFADKPFKSATRGGADLSKVKKDGAADDAKADDDTKNAETPKGFDVLVGAFKTALGDVVKDVRASDRLTDSAVCLVADEGDMDIHLERLLKQHKQLADTTPRILELNPAHDLVKKLAKLAEDKAGKDPVLDDAAYLLLDQARIVEGESVPDAPAFARRMASVMARGLG